MMCKKAEITAENIFIFLEWAHHIVIDSPVNDMKGKKNRRSASVEPYNFPAINIATKKMLKIVHTIEIKIVIIS